MKEGTDLGSDINFVMEPIKKTPFCRKCSDGDDPFQKLAKMRINRRSGSGFHPA